MHAGMHAGLLIRACKPCLLGLVKAYSIRESQGERRGYRGLEVGSVEAHQQPGECGAVDGLELLENEVMLSAALTKINFCGELDEEDGTIGEGVPASHKLIV